MYILNIARTIKKDVCQQNQRLYLCKTMIKKLDFLRKKVNI